MKLDLMLKHAKTTDERFVILQAAKAALEEEVAKAGIKLAKAKAKSAVSK